MNEMKRELGPDFFHYVSQTDEYGSHVPARAHVARAHTERRNHQKPFSPHNIASDSGLQQESAVQKTQENDMENDREIAELMIGKTSSVVEARELRRPEYPYSSSSISTRVIR